MPLNTLHFDSELWSLCSESSSAWNGFWIALRRFSITLRAFKIPFIWIANPKFHSDITLQLLAVTWPASEPRGGPGGSSGQCNWTFSPEATVDGTVTKSASESLPARFNGYVLALPLLPPYRASENSEASTRNPVLYRASSVFLALTVSFVVSGWQVDNSQIKQEIAKLSWTLNSSEGMKRMQGKFQALNSKTTSDSSIVIIHNDKLQIVAPGPACEIRPAGRGFQHQTWKLPIGFGGFCAYIANRVFKIDIFELLNLIRSLQTII